MWEPFSSSTRPPCQLASCFFFPHFSYTDIVPRRVESLLWRAPWYGPLWNPLEPNPGGLRAHPGRVHPFTVTECVLPQPLHMRQGGQAEGTGSPLLVLWHPGIQGTWRQGWRATLASWTSPPSETAPGDLQRLVLGTPMGSSWGQAGMKSISLLVCEHRRNGSSMGIGWMDLTTWMFSTNLIWWTLLKV